jgi:tannase
VPIVAEANGTWPQPALGNFIESVERNVKPVTLNGTGFLGADKGQNQQICGRLLRPPFVDDGMRLECFYDQTSINGGVYDQEALNMPVY